MESTQNHAEQLIARYLAGRLPAAESEAFERSVSAHADLRGRVEEVLRFKEGLARLQERGELAALLSQAPVPRRWLPYAAAAAVAIVALGTLWLKQPRPTALLARSPNEFATRQLEPPQILATYVLARTRGAAPVTDVRSRDTPGVVELRALPSALSPLARYSVQMRRLEGLTRGAIVGQIDAVPAAPDGYVTAYLNCLQLKPGDYEVSVTPSVATEANAEADRFVIHVR